MLPNMLQGGLDGLDGLCTGKDNALQLRNEGNEITSTLVFYHHFSQRTRSGATLSCCFK